MYRIVKRFHYYVHYTTIKELNLILLSLPGFQETWQIQFENVAWCKDNRGCQWEPENKKYKYD